MKPEHYTVPCDLYEWLVDYALELRGEWAWKRNTIKRNAQQMAKIDEHISRAVQIREEWKTRDPK